MALKITDIIGTTSIDHLTTTQRLLLSLSLSRSYNLQCKFHIYSLKSKYVTHCRKWESSKQEKIHVLKVWVQNSAYVYNEIL